MADYLNPQDLANAKIDAKTLGEAVNDKKIVKPRYGESYKSIPMLSADGDSAISELKNAIDIAAAAGAGANGWTDKLVQTWSGRTQESVNKQTYYIEDYLRDGVDFGDSLLAAINAAQGACVNLKGGKTYTLNKRVLTRLQNVNINGNGATIHCLSENTPLIAEPNLPQVFTPTQGYIAGEDYFRCRGADLSKIKVGDTLKILSKVKFALARDAYRVGTTFTVKRIEGDKVYFTGMFPVNIPSSEWDGENYALFIYPRYTFKLKNITLSRQGIPDNTTNTLSVANAAYVELSDVFETNGSTGIAISSCASIDLENVSTFNHPRNTGLNYGVVLNATGYNYIKNSTITSSSTGIATGGTGFVYSSIYDGGYFSSEVENYGWSGHDNTYMSEVRGATIHGLKMAGNVKFSRCTVAKVSFKDISEMRLVSSHDSNLARFSFDECNFLGNPTIAISKSEADLAGEDRDKIGLIEFNNCTGRATLVLDYKTPSGKNLTVDALDIRGASELEIKVLCDIKSLSINSSHFNNYFYIDQSPNSFIDSIIASGCTVTRLTNTKLLNFNSLVFNCVNELASASGGHLQLEGAGSAKIVSCNIPKTTFRCLTNLGVLTVNSTEMIGNKTSLNNVSKLQGDFFRFSSLEKATPANGVVKHTYYNSGVGRVVAIPRSSGVVFNGFAQNGAILSLSFSNKDGVPITSEIEYFLYIN